MHTRVTQNRVADLQRTDKALQPCECEFWQVVELAPQAIFVQTEGRFTYLNPAALKCFGAESADQLLSQPVIDRIPLRFQAEFKKRLKLVNEERRMLYPSEKIYLKLNGSPFELEVSAVPIHWGGRDGALVFFRDITQSKHAEMELRSLACFPGENPNPVLRVARDGRLLYANRSSQRLLEHWQFASVGKVLPAAECAWIADTLERGGIQHQVVTCGEVTYSLEFTPIKGAGYVNIYGRDITEYKRVEDELHASREQLRALATNLQKAREAERSRVAREIHDVLAQELTRLKIDLVWLQGRLTKSGQSNQSVAVVARVAEMGGSLIRRFNACNQSPRACDPRCWTAWAYAPRSNGRFGILRRTQEYRAK